MQSQTVNLIDRKTLKELVYLASLAPSGHNTQPWRFSISGNEIQILPDFSRRLAVVDPDDHALYISLGCAVENLAIAAQSYGLKTEIRYNLSSHDASKITIAFQEQDEQGQSITGDSPQGSKSSDGLSQRQLFQAIELRQSTRRPFSGPPIPAEHLRQLELAGQQEGVRLWFFTTPAQIQSLVVWVKEGNRQQFSNQAFVDELLSWIRFRKGVAKTHRDGLVGPVMGLPNISIPRWLGSLIMRATATPEGQAKQFAKLIQQSNALLLFSVEHNDREHWVKLGRSFERVALAATALNIKQAHLNMPCEVLEVREEMKRHLALDNTEPLLLIRLGYGEPMPYSPRRPLSSIIHYPEAA